MVWYDSNGMIATIGLMEVSKAEEPHSASQECHCSVAFGKGRAEVHVLLVKVPIVFLCTPTRHGMV